MTPLPWVKLHIDILSDEKLMRAARKGARGLELTPWLLAFAGKADDDGRLTVGAEPADADDIAHHIPCVKPAAVSACLAALLSLGVLERDGDALRFTNWERRAGKQSDRADAIRERVAKHRAMKRPAGVTNVENETPGNALHVDDVTRGNADETRIDKEKEGEGEQDEENKPCPTAEPCDESGNGGPHESEDRSPRASLSYPPPFDAVWDAYPRRDGSNPKRKAYGAWKARRGEGVSADEMAAGVARYAAWLAAKALTGTEKVMQAARFFGPEAEWRNAWDVQAVRLTPPSIAARPVVATERLQVWR